MFLSISHSGFSPRLSMTGENPEQIPLTGMHVRLRTAPERKDRTLSMKPCTLAQVGDLDPVMERSCDSISQPRHIKTVGAECVAVAGHFARLSSSFRRLLQSAYSSSCADLSKDRKKSTKLGKSVHFSLQPPPCRSGTMLLSWIEGHTS